jgi:hypothetical protein
MEITALPELQQDTTPSIANAHILPKHPARVIFSGASGSGKSNLIISMLLRKDMYAGYFKHIIIISPNLHSDKSYEHILKLRDGELKKKPEDRKTNYMLFNAYVPDVMETMMTQIKSAVEKGKRKPILLLLDDVIADPKLLKSNFLTQIATQGRHYSMSLWISVQSYKAVNRVIRLNITDLIVFKFRNSSELDRVYDEQVTGMAKNTFIDLCNFIFSKPYAFLTMKTTLPNGNNMAVGFDKWIKYGIQDKDTPTEPEQPIIKEGYVACPVCNHVLFKYRLPEHLRIKHPSESIPKRPYIKKSI